MTCKPYPKCTPRCWFQQEGIPLHIIPKLELMQHHLLNREKSESSCGLSHQGWPQRLRHVATATAPPKLVLSRRMWHLPQHVFPPFAHSTAGCVNLGQNEHVTSYKKIKIIWVKWHPQNLSHTYPRVQPRLSVVVPDQNCCTDVILVSSSCFARDLTEAAQKSSSACPMPKTRRWMNRERGGASYSGESKTTT